MTIKSIEIQFSNDKLFEFRIMEDKHSDVHDNDDSQTAHSSPKDVQKLFKIGFNISHGLSATHIPELDFDKPENTGNVD